MEGRRFVDVMLGNGVFLNVCPWDFLDMFIRGGNKRLWGNDHRLDGEKALFCIKKHKKWLIFSIISLFREEIENKSLPLCNKLLNMEDINRIKMVLFEKKRTARWLAGELGVTPSTVSKWCTNTSQPDLACLLKIADLLEVDIKELLLREYKQFLLSQNDK